jgi:hypothetical protein
VDTSPSGRLDAIERARYKLRQANVALRYLRHAPTEIASDPRRGRPPSDHDLLLSTFFFSCLGLAKSAFYTIMNDHGRRNKATIHGWRKHGLGELGCRQFNRMMELRDNDVHRGLSDGKTLPKMIPVERSSEDGAWMYQQSASYAALGIRRPITEHENPDGSTVSSYDGLQGSVSLYIEIAGETCEACKACERLIKQLGQLIDAAAAAKE